MEKFFQTVCTYLVRETSGKGVLSCENFHILKVIVVCLIFVVLCSILVIFILGISSTVGSNLCLQPQMQNTNKHLVELSVP